MLPGLLQLPKNYKIFSRLHKVEMEGGDCAVFSTDCVHAGSPGPMYKYYGPPPTPDELEPFKQRCFKLDGNSCLQYDPDTGLSNTLSGMAGEFASHSA